MIAEPPGFVDTNVLVYAFDRSEPARRARAAELLSHLASTDRIRLSTQVLQEFFVTVTRKIVSPIAVPRALELLNDLAAWPVATVDVASIRRAASLSDEARLSFWDALIVVSAVQSGAATLYTEDLNHGQMILGVEVVDPFR